jgi:hypothetical protein
VFRTPHPHISPLPSCVSPLQSRGSLPRVCARSLSPCLLPVHLHVLPKRSGSLSHSVGVVLPLSHPWSQWLGSEKVGVVFESSLVDSAQSDTWLWSFLPLVRCLRRWHPSLCHSSITCCEWGFVGFQVFWCVRVALVVVINSFSNNENCEINLIIHVWVDSRQLRFINLSRR